MKQLSRFLDSPEKAVIPFPFRKISPTMLLFVSLQIINQTTALPS